MKTAIETYIETQDKTKQDRLRQIYAVIKNIMPQASEHISYQVPTFKIDNKNVVHFGAGKHHVALYPSPDVITHFAPQLSSLHTSKGTVQFSDDKPLPLTLIEEMVAYRASTMRHDTFPMK